MAADSRDLRLETPLGHLACTWTGTPREHERPTLVCIPGGTYSRAYFDLPVAADPTYSFVEYARAAGWATLCVDVLGTGDSDRPPNLAVGLDEQAAALDYALKQLRDVVGASGAVIAIGHSMGGYVAMRVQARYRTFAALAIWGTTNQHVAPLSLGSAMLAAAATAEGRRALVAQIEATMPDPYLAGGREALLQWFHLDDVPSAVLAADRTTETVIPRRCAAMGTVPGIGVDDAASVDVPVLLCYGEVDVSPDPRCEPAFFTHCDDISMLVLEGSAHCHNMSRVRTRLWDRTLRWAEMVSN